MLWFECNRMVETNYDFYGKQERCVTNRVSWKSQIEKMQSHWSIRKLLAPKAFSNNKHKPAAWAWSGQLLQPATWAWRGQPLCGRQELAKLWRRVPVGTSDRSNLRPSPNQAPIPWYCPWWKTQESALKLFLDGPWSFDSTSVAGSLWRWWPNTIWHKRSSLRGLDQASLPAFSSAEMCWDCSYSGWHL